MFVLLYDLGYGPVIFSARIGGFVSVPTCDDLAPSSSLDPCRVGLRGRGCTRSSVKIVWHRGNSH